VLKVHAWAADQRERPGRRGRTLHPIVDDTGIGYSRRAEEGARAGVFPRFLRSSNDQPREPSPQRAGALRSACESSSSTTARSTIGARKEVGKKFTFTLPADGIGARMRRCSRRRVTSFDDSCWHCRDLGTRAAPSRGAPPPRNDSSRMNNGTSGWIRCPSRPDRRQELIGRWDVSRVLHTPYSAGS